jgi:hypothetical protein
MEDKTLRKCFTQDDGKKPAAKRCREQLKEWRDRGLKFIPHANCNNQDAQGQCLGHDKE